MFTFLMAVDSFNCANFLFSEDIVEDHSGERKRSFGVMQVSFSVLDNIAHHLLPRSRMQRSIGVATSSEAGVSWRTGTQMRAAPPRLNLFGLLRASLGEPQFADLRLVRGVEGVDGRSPTLIWIDYVFCFNSKCCRQCPRQTMAEVLRFIHAGIGKL
jgi:hypothetical protein